MLLELKDAFVCEGYDRCISYEFDLSGYETANDEFPFNEPVKVDVRVMNHAGVVTLTGKVDYVYSSLCDRCCAPIRQNLSISFSNVLVKALSGEGSDDYILVPEEELNLDRLVTTVIILNLPMKHLCSPDCKGLCPVCGKNLNDGLCGCSAGGNSAFSSLKDLIE